MLTVEIFCIYIFLINTEHAFSINGFLLQLGFCHSGVFRGCVTSSWLIALMSCILYV